MSIYIYVDSYSYGISFSRVGGTSGAPDEYEWGYCYKEHPSSTHECVPGKWPCPPGISYHPRGPIGLE